MAPLLELGKLSEAEWQKQVIDLAHVYGWTVAHFRPARTAHGWRTPVSADGKGFPDLVLVRHDELIFLELKSDTGRLSNEQKDWLEKLSKVPGISVALLKPSQFGDLEWMLKPKHMRQERP